MIIIRVAVIVVVLVVEVILTIIIINLIIPLFAIKADIIPTWCVYKVH